MDSNSLLTLGAVGAALVNAAWTAHASMHKASRERVESIEMQLARVEVRLQNCETREAQVEVERARLFDENILLMKRVLRESS